MARKICTNCHREMEDTNFYTYKNGQKVQMCKACLTMHVDNFDESTYLWILEKMDVPYIPEEWNILRDRAYAKSPQKMNGMSVIGKYLSKMKLKQFKSFSWADSAKLQEQRKKNAAVVEQQERAQAQRIKAQFENGEITQAQFRTLVSTQYQKEHEYLMPPPPVQNPIGQNNMFDETKFLPEQDLPQVDSQLTLEDKQYLAMKWGRTYTAAEWVELEKTYTEMMNSFDIHDADSKNTLIFICKTYLKMNQAIDSGDVQGYQRLARVYGELRKSAKFTAAQNKEEKTDFIDSVGQLVAYCQKNGHAIPRYQITTPLDIVDKVIQDMKRYNRQLIYQDTALARQIQDYIKTAKAAAARKKDLDEAHENGQDDPLLTDEDTVAFKDFIARQKEATEKEISGGEEE